MIDANFAPMDRATFAPFWAFAQQQRGQFGTFTFIAPIYSNTAGTATGTLKINNGAGYSAGDSTINVDGLTGTLKAGDFIRFTAHEKVYTITNDAATALNIEPPLTAAVTDNEQVEYNSVAFTVAYANDTQEMDVSTGGFVSHQISLIEVV